MTERGTTPAPVAGEPEAGAVPDGPVLDAVAAAVVVVDLTGQVLRWNAGAERLYGYDAGRVRGASAVELLAEPADRERAAEVLGLVAAGRSWAGDVAVRTADGAARLVHLTAAPLHAGAQPVALVATGYDVGDLRFDQARAADRESRLVQSLVAAEVGTWRWDAATGRTDWDATLEVLFGLPPGGFDGTFETWVGLLHPDDRGGVLATVQAAVAARAAYDLRHRVVHPSGQVRWIEGRGEVTVVAGEVTGTVGCSWDVTDRVRAEEATAASLAAAEEAGARLRRLQQVTADLAAATDVPDVVVAVRDHARDALGAWSGGIALPEQRRPAVTLHAAYADPALPPRVVGPVDVAVDLPMTDVARTGTALYLRSRDEACARYPAAAPLFATAGSSAVACEPIPAQVGGLPGVLVISHDHEHEWAEDERVLLRAMAQQCGVALERARLHAETRRVAERLQAGLLPRRVPVLPGLDVGAGYRPGGEETEQLGGDWYDVLPQDGGSVLLVVGDVMGRGVDAAATMARLSTAVRAFASVDPAPGSVLGKLDRFARLEAAEEFATALLVLLEPVTGAVTVACAGHLPVLVVGAGGCRAVAAPECPPVGLAEAPRPLAHDVVAPGEALVLVTDGLVERPGEDVEDALVRAGERAGALLAGGRSAQEVVAALVEDAGADASGDDMTVLVVARR